MTEETAKIDQQTDILTWLIDNQSKILGLTIIVLGVAGAVLFTRHAAAKKEAEANAALFSLRPSIAPSEQETPIDPAKYLTVANDYIDTASGARALILAAKGYAEAKEWSKALETFERFLTLFPNHSLVPTAQLSKAICQEALGKTDEALATYQTIATSHSQSHVAPQAEVSIARLQEAKGQVEQAMLLYDKLNASTDMTYWHIQARERRSQLLKLHPELEKKAPEPSLESASTNAEPSVITTTTVKPAE